MYGTHHCGPRGRRGGGYGWGFEPGAMAGFWGMHGGGRRRGPRGGRVFEHGDLKYVILQLIAEKPRHGYEIIKELEDRVGGAYSPSPGAVYPTLSLLEDLGHARSTTEADGRKVYEITEQGRKYLEEHRGTVDDIFERVADLGSEIFGSSMAGLGQAFGKLGRAVFQQSARGGDERIRRIQEILERAARDIRSMDTES